MAEARRAEYKKYRGLVLYQHRADGTFSKLAPKLQYCGSI